MKTERKYMLERDKFGTFYHVYSLDDDFIEAYSRDELSFLGIPQEVFQATKKGPVTFKLTFEAHEN